jgi:hypothetical protein
MASTFEAAILLQLSRRSSETLVLVPLCYVTGILAA